MLFSASMIVFGTLFVYVFALSDDDVSRREQTMVRPQTLYRGIQAQDSVPEFRRPG